MELFLQILAYTIPALVVFVMVYIVMRKFFGEEEARRRYLLAKECQKTTLPVQFTAYERLVLFLERISPDSLLVRLHDSKLTALQYHASLLVDIRAEFEHNVAQQIYVSDEAWNVTKNAKENIIQMINACAAKVPPEAPAEQLAGVILGVYQEGESPTALAISFLKSEIKRYFI
ncbi:MAG: hypothetical protein MJ003_01125 [Paludibacteraceae bacterium]|nr:hypothetical protein [Paludibacteraceae bacterium]